jgi:thiamine-monophosphate kinase
MKMPRADEFQLIERYFAPLTKHGDGEISAFDLKDDAASIKVPQGKELVVSQDALSENIHFFENDPLDLIAQKALRTNVSDLIAKGATPYAYSLALGLPKDFEEDAIKQFSNGLSQDQDKFGLTLSGGDTFKSPNGLIIAITAMGLVDEGAYKSRLDANIGDIICTSGTIGDAALGLQVRLGELKDLPKEHENFLRHRYLLPQPRIELVAVISQYATASMDISDGLVGDLIKLLEASNLSASLELDKIPLSNAAQSLPQYIETCITGGDDYELLFTVPKIHMDEIYGIAATCGVPITAIGEVKSFSGDMNNRLDILDKTGKPLSLTQNSYVHF